MNAEQKALKQFIQNVQLTRYSDASANLSKVIEEKMKRRIEKVAVSTKKNARNHK